MEMHNEAVFSEVIRFGSEYVKSKGWYDDGDWGNAEGPIERYQYCPENYRFEFIFIEIVVARDYYRYSATVPFRVSSSATERQRVNDLIEKLNGYVLPGKCLPGKFELDADGHLIYKRTITISEDVQRLPVKDELLSGIKIVEETAPLLLEAIFTNKYE